MDKLKFTERGVVEHWRRWIITGSEQLNRAHEPLSELIAIIDRIAPVSREEQQ